MKNNTVTVTITGTELSYSIRKPNTVREVGAKYERVNLYTVDTDRQTTCTEYLTAVIEQYAPIIARKALKTVNAKAWTEKVENMLYHNDTDFEDVVQTARESIWTLYTVGLIEKPSDIFEYSSYVYRKINKVLNDNRAVTARFTQSLYWTDENGEEHVISAGQADKRLSRVERADVLTYVSEMLRGRLSARTDSKAVLAVFAHLFIYGKTERETADALKMERRQISRYVSYIRNTLQCPEFHEYLTQIINEQ